MTRFQILLRLCVAGGVLVAFASPATAQLSAATVAGGYSYLRELGTGATPTTTYPNGWFATLTARLGRFPVAAAGEINVSSRKNVVDVQRLQAFLGGVQVRVVRAWRMGVFANALVGTERFSEPGFSETGFAFQPGAGVDVGIARSMALRVQVDYRLVNQAHVTFKEVRTSVGAAVGFGGNR